MTESTAKPAGPRDLRGRAVTTVATVRGIAAGLLLIYATALLTGVARDWATGSAAHLATAGFLACGAATCLVRAVLLRHQRGTWIVVAVAFSFWASGETLFAVRPGGGPLSVANVLSLAFYPTACLALAMMLRAQLATFFTTLWLDGLAGALSVAALVAAFVFPPVLANTGGGTMEVIGAVSYPLGDVLVVAFALFAMALTGWRPGGVLGGAAVAFGVVAMTDAFSLWSAATVNSSREELQWLWPAAALGVAEVAWRARPPAPRTNATSLRLLVFPVLVSLIALGLLLSGLVQELGVAGYELATSSLFLIVVRLGMTVLENLEIADASKREALTDALTGLGNRRRLMIDVETAFEEGAEPAVLVLFDLDGFKSYNDTFGHPAGDALLARLGRALSRAVGPFGSAYRPGGDEFCALLRASSEDLQARIASTVEALSERGSGFAVSPSYGSVVIPAEASDVTGALQLADTRLYEQKGDRRRTRDGAQVRNALMQALRERRPDLDDHIGGVASLAHAVARRFRMSAEKIDEVTRAAELHDIGKMAVPDAVLEKPSSLDEREREMIRQHTVVGERILAVAPALRSIGRLVRYSHERWDGSGYPDRLVGEEIPLGARIIAVCDAFDAMTTDRPYQPAISLDEALAELRRCAGSQFDPQVVELFCDEAEAVHDGLSEPAPVEEVDPELDSMVLRVPEPQADEAPPLH
ncbi:MAG TPA: diguanylate cyclase [Thermoleophilaceae bacterium]|jgi:diguanylate cyclase (GGDEF)-like protein